MEHSYMEDSQKRMSTVYKNVVESYKTKLEKVIVRRYDKLVEQRK